MESQAEGSFLYVEVLSFCGWESGKGRRVWRLQCGILGYWVDGGYGCEELGVWLQARAKKIRVADRIAKNERLGLPELF